MLPIISLGDIGKAMLMEPTKTIEPNDPSQYSNLENLIRLRMRSRKGRKIRNRKSILLAILEACRSPAVEHWIMIKARVGYQSFAKYSDKLLSEGKVVSSRTEEQNGRRTRTYYTLTKEGLQMLEELRSEQT